MTPKFQSGETAATPGAIEEFGQLIVTVCVLRHLSGDWGEIDPADVGLNEQALIDGNRIMSVYEIATEDGMKKLWVITEADRSATTALLPSEY